MVFGGLIFALNIYISWHLFSTEYLNQLDSIEGAYISLTRYILDHAFAFGWFPVWYGGIPYQNTYPPLLHLVVAAVAWWLKISPALAYHAVCGLLYASAPVTFFLMAAEISNDRLNSFLAGLVYSVVSPSVWLVPSVQTWAGSSSNAARLQSLIRFGDGPHVASLAFLPVAVLAVHSAFERWGAMRVVVAAATVTAVVLTNWLGAFSLAMALFSYTAARAIYLSWKVVSGRILLISLIAYGLGAPWIPPSTIASIKLNAEHVGGDFRLLQPQLYYGVLAFLIFIILWYFLRRWQVSVAISFFLLFLALTASLVLSYAWFHVYLVPQPHRYHLELDLAISLALSSFLKLIWPTIGSTIRILLGMVFIGFVFVGTNAARRIGDALIRPIDMTQTVEYEIPTWLDKNEPKKRVFISGSVQFWLNAFADNAELGGGFDQGITNPQISVLYYGIPYTIGDGARTVMWLRLFGANAVVVSEQNGRDAYRQVWRDPRKFAGVLPELWRKGGDVIYDIPQRSSSLAHVIPPEAIPNRSPVNLADTEPVAKLAKALDDAGLPVAEFSWQTPDEAGIRARMMPDQDLFVQVNYHPGWKAYVRGENRPTQRGPLGMLLIEPNCDGLCEVVLRFEGGPEARFSLALRFVVLLGCFLWLAIPQAVRLRRRIQNGD